MIRFGSRIGIDRFSYIPVAAILENNAFFMAVTDTNDHINFVCGLLFLTLLFLWVSSSGPDAYSTLYSIC